MGTTVATPHSEVPSEGASAPSMWADAPVRLSELLWGIDWSDTFPCELKPGIWAEVGSPEAVADFCARHFGSIFGDVQGSGFWLDQGAAKERYLRHACDSIIIRDGTTDVGVVICNPVDWSTYYLRMAAFVPAYQGQNLVKFVVARLCRILTEAGVARFECDAAPSNVRCIATALALGFVVTGTTLSERWGALSRLTRYLNPGAEESYLDRFCAAGRSHRDGRQTVAASRGH
jgi:RimJ/RimL family protein N-acetyltransferase